MVPEGVTSIESEVFIGCERLEEITIPNSVTKMGKSVFYGCDELKSITLGSGLTSVGDNVFGKCGKLKKIIVPAGTAAHFKQLLDGRLHKAIVEKEEGVVKKKENPAKKIKITDGIVVFPDGITEIECGMFSGKSKVVEVVIPSSVTRIGKEAFMEFKNLKSIIIQSVASNFFWISTGPKYNITVINNSIFTFAILHALSCIFI